ncbi:hypothetical protein EG329_011690 [Mollisiaceae sp. DMI_Dod_QoI]|nr:hypothetical protein EG329_011690 [Helotiales sp. DMI_Dod_QoI]
MSTSSASIAESDTSVSTTPTSPTTTISSEDEHPEEPAPWILHHILNPECASELPLTIMFCFNSGQRPHSLREAQTWWQLDRKGRLLTKFLNSLADQGPWTNEVSISKPSKDLGTILEAESSPRAHPLDHFSMPENQTLLRKVRFVTPPETKKPMKSVLDKYLPEKEEDQVQGLPYEFIRDFCHKEFPTEYERANFNHALTALDYLRDLEFSRRAQLRAAGRRWGITEHNWKGAFTSNKNSYAWYLRMQHEEKEIQKWFANIYVGLRIWIMINELKQPRLSRKEVLAMLNTLYPPVILSVPNDEISIKQLQLHRQIIYGWILEVEEKGPGEIIAVEEAVFRGKHSWRKVTLSLENYLKHAHIHIQYAFKAGQGRPKGSSPKPKTRLPPVTPLSMDVGVVDGECACCPKGMVDVILHPKDEIKPEDKQKWKLFKVRAQPEKPIEKTEKESDIEDSPRPSTSQGIPHVESKQRWKPFKARAQQEKPIEKTEKTEKETDIEDTPRPSTSQGVPQVESKQKWKPFKSRAQREEPMKKTEKEENIEDTPRPSTSQGIPQVESQKLATSGTIKPLGFIPPLLPEDPTEDISSLIPRPLFANANSPPPSPLPSDGFAFLNHDPFSPPPILRKPRSISSLFTTSRKQRVDSKIGGDNTSLNPDFSDSASLKAPSVLSIPSLRTRRSLKNLAMDFITKKDKSKSKEKDWSTPGSSPLASEFGADEKVVVGEKEVEIEIEGSYFLPPSPGPGKKELRKESKKLKMELRGKKSIKDFFRRGDGGVNTSVGGNESMSESKSDVPSSLPNVLRRKKSKGFGLSE